MSTEKIFVKILDKEYQVACPTEEKGALIKSAEELDRRMRAIKGSGSIIGLERIAVMAALNLSHDLLKSEGAINPATEEDLQRMNSKVDALLERFN